METMNITAVAVSEGKPPPRYWVIVFRRLCYDHTAIVCAIILVSVVLASVFAPVIAPADPYITDVSARLKSPGFAGHLLGTDELGRDLLSRLVYGGRLTFFMGVVPVIISFVIGTFLGISAGYIGGRLNTIIMRAMDVFYAFPSVLLAIAISGTLGPGMSNAMLALIIVWIPPITRVAESVTAQICGLPFVDAAKASGASSASIIFFHVLNNVLGPILVYATSLISVNIVVAAGLSFLGLGVQPPQPEWGAMLNTLRTALYINPWLAAIPGIMIFITSLCFNLLSDSLRTAMDIRKWI